MADIIPLLYPNLKSVTIFTDASYDSRRKIGGYAYQIIGEFPPVKAYGGFKKEMHSIHQCELGAICKALYRLFYELGIPKGITIYSDSLSAIEMLNEEGGHELYDDIAQWARNEIQKRDIRTLSLRHVPAHTGLTDGKYKANEWCDRFAKKAMKTTRKNWNKK